ncbi:SDR family oxidoreductase [Curvivirga aplysinae]|uniref:SDR family oxidoreductase n=1 Tax=Curvivirga aplysinae TaxID=2529852 RepID=UPI0012BD802F|nr:SDR family oxidoreductase [Curvivirga aplysinae]MTI08415.1 SDR family oxidoreductase [Curvivirga aplysinae]
MFDLKDKVILITGASRGIGAAAAKLLAKSGSTVVLTARSEKALHALVAEIEGEGGKAAAIACDVAKYNDVSNAVNFAVETFGKLDVLVNNAGIIDPIAKLADSDPDAWDQVVDINFKGVYHGIRAVLPSMLTQGSGTIINISSGAATSILEGWSHYCSTKAAVLSLTKAVHKEYADQGIRSIGLSPGTVATHMQVAIKESGINPVSQLDPNVHISPEWVGQAIAYLCTDDADKYCGMDFSLKTDEGRLAVGLPTKS